MLTPEQIVQFRADGFVKGEKILSDEEVDVLRAEMERVIAERDRADIAQPVRIVNLSGDDAHPVWQIVNISRASKPFAELVHHPTITADIAALTEASELRLWHDQIQYKPAELGGTNHWHQDSPLWPILRPNDQQVTAWVALDDVDESNGCMSMVPGSYKWGDQIAFLRERGDFTLPEEFEGRRIETRLCPVKKGEVHYHHALTWHGSHQNTSKRPRRAIAIHLMTEKTTYHAAGDHIMKEFVTVADGAKLEGDAFPLVYRRDRAA